MSRPVGGLNFDDIELGFRGYWALIFVFCLQFIVRLWTHVLRLVDGGKFKFLARGQ